MPGFNHGSVSSFSFCFCGVILKADCFSNGFCCAVSLTAKREPPKAIVDQARAAREMLAKESVAEHSHTSEADSLSGDSGSEMSAALTELSMAGSNTRSASLSQETSNCYHTAWQTLRYAL